jgi:hypothetical protein
VEPPPEPLEPPPLEPPLPEPPGFGELVPAEGLLPDAPMPELLPDVPLIPVLPDGDDPDVDGAVVVAEGNVEEVPDVPLLMPLPAVPPLVVPEPVLPEPVVPEPVVPEPEDWANAAPPKPSAITAAVVRRRRFIADILTVI